MAQAWRAFEGSLVPVVIAVCFVAAIVVVGVVATPGLRRRSSVILRGGLLLTWSAGVASLTLTPALGGRPRAVSLVPFVEIVEMMTRSVWWQVPAVQIGGNIAMFMPLGLLLAVHPRWGVGRAVAAGLVVVVAIESLQFALGTGRVASIDDVLLAVVGALLGALIAKGAVRLVRVAGVGRTDRNLRGAESTDAARSGM